MARVKAFHLENTKSRNAYWRAYIIDLIDPDQGKPFWITHWGGLSTTGQFQVHQDGYASYDMAITKRDQKAWDRGYDQVANHDWTIESDLAAELASYSGRQACTGPFWTLAREFTAVIAGGEPLDDIYAALREMIAELAD